MDSSGRGIAVPDGGRGDGVASFSSPVRSRRSGLILGMPRRSLGSRFGVPLRCALRFGRAFRLGCVLRSCGAVFRRGFVGWGRSLDRPSPLDGLGTGWGAMNRGGSGPGLGRWRRCGLGGLRPRCSQSQRQQEKTGGKRQPRMLRQGFTHRYNLPQPAGSDHSRKEFLWLAGIIDAAGGRSAP